MKHNLYANCLRGFRRGALTKEEVCSCENFCLVAFQDRPTGNVCRLTGKRFVMQVVAIGLPAAGTRR